MASQITKIEDGEVAASYRIQGKTVSSMPEVYFAIALEKYGWQFEYRASFFGYQFTRKGLEIDFRVFTTPKQTFVFLDGEYWHGSQNARERDKFERIKLFAAARKYAFEPVVVLASEAETPELAEATVSKLFSHS